eukprot:Tbor_TRINITY_DN5386_c1_g4::TRINITY_DN5386_c1_g4_i1::g.3936::m.3936
MSEEQLSRLYKSMKKDEEKAFLTIAWELAGRVSDILKLKIENCKEEKKGKQCMFSFHFVEGKTATNDNYWLSTKITQIPVLRFLREKIKQKRGKLFSITKGEIGEKLKLLKLECRSIRKGKLVSLARAGVPIAEILKLSRHKQEGTLFKYIGFKAEELKNWGNKKKEKVVRGGRAEGPPAKIPRWTKFGDCPSHEDLQKAFPDETPNWQRKKWPVKLKMVNPLNIKKLQDLTCKDRECGEFNLKQLPWLKDESLYIQDPNAKNRVRPTDFTATEEDMMNGYKWEETIDDPKGVTYGFKIAEPKKERSRPV